jgi:cytochrome c-type biogenesis protein CcmE
VTDVREVHEEAEITPLKDAAVARATRNVARARRRLAVVGIVIALAVGFLLYKTLTSAVSYFKTGQQALASRSLLGTSTFQLEGVVVAHTIAYPHPTEVDFTIASGTSRIRVENTGLPPELFQPNIPVVLVGHFVGSSDLFASDQILVKHSNQYIAAHPGRVTAPNGSVR